MLTQPSHGTLSGTAPNLTYTPAAGFRGGDTLAFKVSDGAADSAPVTVTLTVLPPSLPRRPLTRTSPGSWTAYQAGDTPRLLESYTATPTFDSQENVAHLYDSVLALLAFLARGTPENLARARAIAEALVSLQQNDPQFNDGRLRDAYPADSLLDESGVARLQLASTHTGNLAWAILGLLRYHQAQGGEKFLEAAIKIGEWTVAHTLDTRGAGGFTGGVDEALQPIRWKSTEHNLDLYAAFMRLYEVTQERRWLGWAAHARGFVEAMWEAGESHFWTGTLEDGITLNREPTPLDVQAQAPNTDGGGIVAACSDGVETGYGWGYFNALHVGATAWYLLAEQGVNPLEDPVGSIGPSVSGTVRDSKKQPVSGVRVEARGADDTLMGVGITDDQGNYRLELPAGSYTLTPHKESHLFSPASRKLTVKARNLGKINFTVKLLTLSGAVKDKKGKPLAKATLSLLQGGGTLDTTVTNAKGKYRFSLYNPGTYTVVPSRPGSRFAPESKEVAFTKGNRGGINFKEAP